MVHCLFSLLNFDKNEIKYTWTFFTFFFINIVKSATVSKSLRGLEIHAEAVVTAFGGRRVITRPVPGLFTILDKKNS